MATSFAAYASQYLTRQQNGPAATASASIASEQPMFFSFTTDDDEEGSRFGFGGRGRDLDLDDGDDPHLGLGLSGGASTSAHAGASGYRPARDQAAQEEEDEDPYLRLDEDEQVHGSRTMFRQQHEQQSIPLIARSPNPSRLGSGSPSPDSPPGWLAHLARSPPSARGRTPSEGTEESDGDNDSSPPMDLVVASPRGHGQARAGNKGYDLGGGSKNVTSASTSRPPSRLIPPPLRTSSSPPSGRGHAPQSLSISLTDSLLPRDGTTRPFTFSLPDPRHTPLHRRKYNDTPPLTLFLALLSCTLLASLLLLLLTARPPGVPAVILPYTIMVRTLPVLVGLVCVSAVGAYAHVWLLGVFVGPVMVATEVGVPVMLFGCAVWAFVGSFGGGEGATWGESVGLRIFSLLPLTLSLLTAHRLLTLPTKIKRTSALLTLLTHILLANPLLLLLSPFLLILMLVLSVPFVTVIFRLLLIGYATGVKERGTLEWHVRASAGWGIVGVLGVWAWCWAVARGVLRTTAAGVVGAWYFSDPSLPPPPPTSTHTLHAALTRSTGPSLGTIILASLILTLLRLLTLLIFLLHRLPPLLLRIPYIPWVPLAVPVAAYVVPGVRALVGWLEGVGERVSGYALVFVGLGGVGFWEAAGLGVGVVRGRSVGGQEGRQQGQGQGRRSRGRGGQQQQPTPTRPRPLPRKPPTEPPLAILTLSPLTLTLPSSLLTYLFVAHTLGAPHEALGAALLAGGMTAVVGLFCTGLVRDVGDAVWVCWVLDGENREGKTRREVVGAVFGNNTGVEEEERGNHRGPVLPLHHNPLSNAGQTQAQGNPLARQQRQPRHIPANPETIIPRSPLARREEKGAKARGLDASLVGAGVLFDVGGEEGEGSDDGGYGQTQTRTGNQSKGKGRQQQQVYAGQSQRQYQQQQQQPHQQQNIVPYQIGDDSDLESELDTAPEGARPVHVPGRRQEEEEEEEDPLDPFKSSRHVDEEAFVGSGRTPRGGSAGTTPTTAAMAGMGTRQGTGFPNINLGGLNFAPGVGVGGGIGGGAGAGKGVSMSPGSGVGAFGGFTGSPGHGHNMGPGHGHAHARSTSGGGGAMGGLAGAQQRMLSSTQELNMKSQFLMGMQRSGGSERQEDREGEEEEEEGSVLGPGSGFFN